jgi:hypothetical protein
MLYNNYICFKIIYLIYVLYGDIIIGNIIGDIIIGNIIGDIIIPLLFLLEFQYFLHKIEYMMSPT